MTEPEPSATAGVAAAARYLKAFDGRDAEEANRILDSDEGTAALAGCALIAIVAVRTLAQLTGRPTTDYWELLQSLAAQVADEEKGKPTES